MAGEPDGAHAAPRHADDPRPMRLHWVFHFIVLPALFALAAIAIIGLVSVYLSPGGYYDGNALDALRSSIPVAVGVLLAFAILAVFTFAGLYGLRKWSLVTLIVLLVMLIAAALAASAVSWAYLAQHGALVGQVSPGFASALGATRFAGIAVAVVALLFIVYYARRAGQFVTAAELREQRRLVDYDKW